DPQIAVTAAHDCPGRDSLHFLRHDADVGPVTAVVGEAIEAEAIVETTEQVDVVLEPDIGPASAAPAPAAAATMSAKAAAAAAESRGMASAAAPTCKLAAAAARSVEAVTSANLPLRRPARLLDVARGTLLR